jgi:hypothetical protein
MAAPMDPMQGEVTPESVVGSMLSKTGQEKLAPLKAVMDEYGWPMSAEQTMIVAQKDDRTKGKTPTELADMLRADPTIYDDLEAMDSGKMDKMKSDMGIKSPSKAATEKAAKTEMPEGDMNFDQKAAFMEKKAKAEMPGGGM